MLLAPGAFSFWSSSAASGMQSYKENNVAELADCDATVEFVKKVNCLADAMNSNTPRNALKPGNSEWENIESFLVAFKAMRAYANEKLRDRLEKAAKATEEFQKKQTKAQSKRKRKAPPANHAKPDKVPEAFIFSESSDIGLLVTLQATKEICTFLTEKCGYQYLMTARLNQDALERFFGLVRQSAGQNTHPEPKVFAQLFRLLSLYSLVRPLKGSNITGGEMLHTLLNLEDFRNKAPEVWSMMDDVLDEELVDEELVEDSLSLLDDSLAYSLIKSMASGSGKHTEDHKLSGVRTIADSEEQ
ncbi:uncharacterized protein LOC127749402 [Frankliniella occidentalis]|uniref:Uncharacterized protein LOC127749402 n=1 Tax=Frankliniella occidentalis TaxID=133901 RepID=A0A9C6WPC0_FRAOC|nr:uncharacterized protein LOC127749402 [Frankliniella occidentalis]